MDHFPKFICYLLKAGGWALDGLIFAYWAACTLAATLAAQVEIPESWQPDQWALNLLSVGLFLVLLARAIYIATRKK